MIMLIDTREPDDQGQPAWEPDWPVWWRGTLAAALGIAAFFTAGGLAAVDAARLILRVATVEKGLPYHHGLGEYHQ